MTARAALRRGRAIRAATLTLAAVFWAAPSPACGAPIVWPLEHYLEAHPDEAVTAVIHVANPSEELQEVHLYLTDWEPGSLSPSPGPAGTGSRSLAPFLMGSLPSRLVLAAQEQTALSLTFARPPGDGGSRWLSVVLESDVPAPVPSADAPAAGTVTFRLRRRQQVRIYHTALPAASPEGFVAAIESSPERPTRWLVTYANSTDRVFPVTGQWRLTAAAGNTVASGSVPRFLAYPGETVVTVDGGLSFSPGISLSPGTYHLLVVLYPEAEGAQNARAGELVLRIGEGSEGAMAP